MGRGLSQRHRQKRAERANDGNLHKARLGKAGATAHLALPEPPGPSELAANFVPRSLKKMLAMKAKADAAEAGRSRKNGQQRQQEQQRTQPIDPPPVPAGKRKQQQQQQQQQQQRRRRE
uniref:Uncharacterized protein n=1 Tax=Chlamydomonas euryale TaxID=1486919 RepID=A0A7R9VPT8_9CHLO|mmetsp:Transcript_41727/g.124785  ORF Transcript_41727/g.124785 Transcript_41727/m.124785 type:complete len:119 (+) Transcript_41727:88-444(+)